jgi:Uri superfamily endonuclease
MMNLSVPRESRRGQLYNSPQISHRIERSIKKKKNDRVHFNYLHVGRDVLLSRIYRALETNAKVYKLSGCVETFSLNYYVHCTW